MDLKEILSSPHEHSSNTSPRTAEDRAFDALEENATKDLADFLAMLGRMVPYPLFSARATHSDYRRLFLLVTLDLFSNYDEEGKRLRTGREPAEQRALPVYAEIYAKVVAAAEALAADRTMDEASEKLEEVFVREQIRLGLAGRVIDRPNAISSFLDRRSAKKGKEPDAGRGMYFPEGFIEAIRLGFELSRGQLDGSVSAAALNTPKLVGSGDA